LDIKDGFWHVKLGPKSQDLCSFLTPFGTYSFKRLLFGVCLAPEIFKKFKNLNFGDLKGVTIDIDVILITGNSKKERDDNLRAVIERAKRLNVKFNLKKFQYCQKEVKFLGFLFSGAGMKIDEDRLEAIRQLKSPRNQKGLQFFFGVVNYLRTFVPNLARLEDLLKNIIIFQWTDAHSKIIEDIKQKIVGTPQLRVYDETVPITIQTDSSQDGLGCCLMQEGRPIFFASRAFSDTAQRYAQIEKEFLAITYACKKFHLFIYGRTITVK
jgi:hypothetical protein